MPRGYMEGPAAEEAERRLEELEGGAAPTQLDVGVVELGLRDERCPRHETECVAEER